MNRKGLSPLIATVLLIAFTMAIAGIMASWATQFVSAQISGVQNQSVGITCSGSATVDARIINGKGYAIVSIDSATQDLTEWKGYLLYDDPSKNENAQLSNPSIRLRTGDVYTFNFTNTSANPRYLRISAGNCTGVTRTVPITLIS